MYQTLTDRRFPQVLNLYNSELHARIMRATPQMFRVIEMQRLIEMWNKISVVAKTQIQVDKRTAEELNHLKQFGESYDDVINRLLEQTDD